MRQEFETTMTRPMTDYAHGVLGIAVLALGLGYSGCGLDPETPDPATGGAAGTSGPSAGSSGAGMNTAGTATTAGTGGTANTAGTTGKGGSTSTAGTSSGAGTGGSVSPAGGGGSGGAGPAGSGGGGAGGASNGGTGGGAGGDMGGKGGKGFGGMSGGDGGAGPIAGSGPTAGSGGSGGSGNPGTCERGMTKGEQVLMIGESFIAATHEITREIERQAKANGALADNESYRDNSISGTTLAGGGNSIPNQYQKGVDAGPVKYVLMDGGGNDCLQANNPSGALSAAEGLFQNMQENGTEKVVYFFYPDPIGSQFNSLKSCLDTLRPQMKAMCDELTSPKCYWLDLRDTWNGHNDYTQDGIHPTTAGSVATGKAIWETMVENCVAQ